MRKMIQVAVLAAMGWLGVVQSAAADSFISWQVGGTNFDRGYHDGRDWHDDRRGGWDRHSRRGWDRGWRDDCPWDRGQRYHGVGRWGWNRPYYRPPLVIERPVIVQQPVYYQVPAAPPLPYGGQYVGDTYQRNGQYCREYTTTGRVGGRREQLYGTACYDGRDWTFNR